MKIRVVLFALLLALTPIQRASADACSAVICMFGMVAGGGSGASECASSTAEFFAIAVFTPYFNPSATAIARRAFLSGCGNGVEVQIDSIIAMFGSVP
jgi:hypothetical protein